ncbi:MAG: ATP-binding protein [Nitratireductor sp.]|uniref:type IV secretory system conjugative DNA transfer family protein n=1 Tax=Alphaproteobacteria TaxID=28211 RepID=UPI003264AFF0
MVATKHLGARLHRFVYGFFRQSDHTEVVHLHGRIDHLLQANGVKTEGQLNDLCARVAGDVGNVLHLPDERRDELRHFTAQLIAYEGMFRLPDVDFAETRTTAQYWELKDELNAQKALLERFPSVTDAITLLVQGCFGALYDNLGKVGADDVGNGINVVTPRIDRIASLGEVVERIAVAAHVEEIEHLGLFPRLRKRLEANFVAASGGDPRDIDGFSRPLRMPSKFDAKTPEDLVVTYLSGTPLLELFAGEEMFTIPQSIRFEHHHIIAGSGHGKTQTLQYLIAKDLDAVASGERSVIVIDSQGDLISNIAGLKAFAPGEPLHDRVCIVDPTDIEWPVSLNLFDVGQARLQSYPLLERERLTNSILELYDFVLGTLLSAEMTQKQSVIFRYVTRLMLHIPDATIHTLRELMEKGSEIRFAEHIARLEGTARHFFETEFPSKEFAQTRQQVLRRLWGILENQTFERMFSHPRSKLDLFAEMNAGKVILINTAKDLLKESGTEIFGRFFIAMIAQAAQERATLPESQRMPTMVYIDEAADYFDRNVGIILSQARKFKIGMVLAHQYLGQLDSKLQDAFSANTAIKFAGGFTGKDARAAAQMLNCDPALIEAQPKGAFAAHVRGMTRAAIPLRFPLGALEEMLRMTSDQQNALRDQMRANYAVHYSELSQYQSKSEDREDAKAQGRDDRKDKDEEGEGTLWEQSEAATSANPKTKSNRPHPPGDIEKPDDESDW